MDLKITARDMKLNDRTREYVQDRFDRLTRRFRPATDAQMEVTLTSSKSEEDRIIVQLTLTAPGQTLRAQKRGSTVNVAFDAVADVMDRQIRRYKGRVYRTQQRGMNADKEAEALAALLDVDEDVEENDYEDIDATVVRRKSFPMISMTVEDAIVEMELLNHTFFMFMNVETGGHNVVYRRHDGDFGLIEPI